MKLGRPIDTFLPFLTIQQQCLTLTQVEKTHVKVSLTRFLLTYYRHCFFLSSTSWVLSKRESDTLYVCVCASVLDRSICNNNRISKLSPSMSTRANGRLVYLFFLSFDLLVFLYLSLSLSLSFFLSSFSLSIFLHCQFLANCGRRAK